MFFSVLFISASHTGSTGRWMLRPSVSPCRFVQVFQHIVAACTPLSPPRRSQSVFAVLALTARSPTSVCVCVCLVSVCVVLGPIAYYTFALIAVHAFYKCARTNQLAYFSFLWHGFHCPPPPPTNMSHTRGGCAVLLAVLSALPIYAHKRAYNHPSARFAIRARETETVA